MKFSKYEHKSAAVVLKNSAAEKRVSDNVEGILFPLQKETLDNYVEKRIDKVQEKYAVLVNAKISKKDKEEKTKEEAIKYFNEFMDYLFVKWHDREQGVSAKTAKNKEQLKKLVEKLVKFLRNKGRDNLYIGKRKTKIKDINLELSDESVHELVRTKIRGSLRKNFCYKVSGKTAACYLPDVIEKLMKIVCVESDFVSGMRRIPKEELEKTFLIIATEYNKKIKEDNVVKSIQNQNVRVQVFYEEGEARLELANARHRKKKCIFDLQRRFALGDQNERKKILCELAKLIILFTAGTDVYHKIKNRDIPLWNFNFLDDVLTEETKIFHQECVDIINNRDQIQDKLKKQDEESIEKEKNIRKVNNFNKEIRKGIYQKIRSRYQEYKKLKGNELPDESEFWIEEIERDIEGMFLKDKKRWIRQEELDVKRMCGRLWEKRIEYLRSKYVDIGKGVYHFAMPDLHNLIEKKEIKIGEVQPEFQKGITSFDYERIKAEENLERSFIIYITFAVNNFARAVYPPTFYKKNGNEDILQIKDPETIRESRHGDAGRRIMQFFGGVSQWKEVLGISENIPSDYTEKVIVDIQKAMNQIRNVSFHYASSIPKRVYEEDSPLIKIFNKEREGLSKLYCEKIFSNNVPKFYKINDITKLMDHLYEDTKVDLEAQIPSFKKVLSPGKFIEQINDFVDKEAYENLNEKDIFHHALYYTLKQIYYNCFIKSENLKEKFIEALNEMKKNPQDDTEKWALNSLCKRIDEYEKNISFGNLCQRIMTDYALQNSEMKVQIDKDNSKTDKKYEHFIMLLYKGIRKIFISYYNGEWEGSGEKFDYDFLKKPEFNAEDKEISKEEFCAQWEKELYSDLASEKEGWIISWFIVAHFMTPTHVNHLRGEIKGYFGYVNGIENRRYNIMKKSRPIDEEIKKRYEKVLKVLNLASEYCGLVSVKWEDYYLDENDFAEDIRKYVQYENQEPDKSQQEQLKQFCSKTAADSPSGYINIYEAGGVPIVNRNIIHAKMYGTEKLLSKCFTDDRITEEEIRDFYKKRKELEELFRKGICKEKEEEESKRKYQQEKNRIELQDIQRYSDILNDLMSQLISWCYLRERDKMYFQLGLHYIRLYHDKEKKIVEESSKLRVLKRYDEDHAAEIQIISDGALLYQLAAIYTYELPIFEIQNRGMAKIVSSTQNGSMISASERVFRKKYLGENKSKNSLLEVGMELFENKKKEKFIREYRNYLDHFKYYARNDMSMMELYNKMFFLFFSNDIKLRKSVTVVFRNILARHFVLSKLVFCKESSIEGGKRFVLKDNLKSKTTTHKPEKNIEFEVDYYDEHFLKRLQKILEYKTKIMDEK